MIFAGINTRGRLEFFLKIKGVSRDILIRFKNAN